MKRIYCTMLLLLTLLLVAEAQTADRFAIKNPETTFPGALIAKDSFNKDTHRMLTTPLNAITVSGLPGYPSQTFVPSQKNVEQYIRDYIAEKGLPASYEMHFSTKRSLQSYAESYMDFGQVIPISDYWSADRQTLPKLFLVELSTVYATLRMDMPETLCPDEDIRKEADKWAYVSSVSYGRRVMVIIESRAKNLDMLAAVNEAMQQPEPEASPILANSIIRILLPGGGELDMTDVVHPLTAVKKYMQQPVTEADLLRPIEFTASELTDHSVFVNHFTVK